MLIRLFAVELIQNSYSRINGNLVLVPDEYFSAGIFMVTCVHVAIIWYASKVYIYAHVHYTGQAVPYWQTWTVFLFRDSYLGNN